MGHRGAEFPLPKPGASLNRLSPPSDMALGPKRNTRFPDLFCPVLHRCHQFITAQGGEIKPRAKAKQEVCQAMRHESYDCPCRDIFLGEDGITLTNSRPGTTRETWFHEDDSPIHRFIQAGGRLAQHRAKSSINLDASLSSTEGCGFDKTSNAPAIMASLRSLIVALRE